MTSCYIQDVDPNARVTCGNCGWAGKASETAMIDDIQERITAGETVPAGQCPDEDCGALVYADEPAASSASDTLIELLDDNLTAWEGEEDSVKDEHAELIARLQAYQPKADRYVAALERLWDMLSDTVEAGRLSEADIPDDYRALVEQMVACEAARDAAGREPVEHEPETSPAPEGEERPFTVQLGYAGYWAATLTVNAKSIAEACAKACEGEDRDGYEAAWRSIDHVGETFVDAIAEGDDADPWAEGGLGSALPVPYEFTEAALHRRPDTSR